MKHLIKIETTEHGALSVQHMGKDQQWCDAGLSVFVNNQPDAGWGLQKLYYVVAGSSEKHPIDIATRTFIMPNGNVTIGGVFKRFVIGDWTEGKGNQEDEAVFVKGENGEPTSIPIDQFIGTITDAELDNDSERPVQNKVVTEALMGKQEELVSGQNIKTLNGESLLGDGNIVIEQHFKGWWPDLAALKDAITAVDGDYAYVEDPSPSTNISIYVYDANAESDNYWADSGRDVDSSNVQTFQTGEQVNQVGIESAPTKNSKKLAEGGGIAEIQQTLQSVNRNALIDTDHVISSSDWKYVASPNYDTGWVDILNGSTYIQVANNTLSRITFYSDRNTIDSSTKLESYVDYQLTDQKATVPANAKVAAISFKHSDNASGYDSLIVTQSGMYLTEDDGEDIVESLITRIKSSAKGFFVDYDHIASLSGNTVTYMANTSFDSIWFSIDGDYKDIILENATATRFLFFKKPQIDTANYLGNNTTGEVVEGSKFCCITMRHTDNPDGYDNTLIRWVIADDKNKLIKVTKGSTYTDLRMKLSESNDIIVRMHVNATGNNITFLAYYIGPNTLTDAQLITNTYKVADTPDMVGAVGVSTFWYLYAQHGWAIPKMTVETQTLDGSDIGSIWTDGTHNFVVGKVDGNDIYLLPQITLDSDTGIYSASWWGDLAYPSSLTHVEGAAHTTAITGSSTRYDLVCQSVSGRKFLADGKEITSNGTYYCDELVISEHIQGHSIGKATQWFPTPVFDGSLIDFERTFIFAGLSCTCNTIINTIEPYIVSDYRGCIPQMPLQFGDYHSYSLIPKVKKQVNGHRVDLPFDSDDGTIGSNAVSVDRTSDDLYDVDDQPDRCINYLKDNSGNYLVGMAGGCSIVRGMTVAEKRNQYNPVVASPNDNRSCTYGGSTKNKFYPFLMKSFGFAGGVVDETFVNEMSCYYCWFNPSENNGQVYWYKDGNQYILYIHNQSAHDKLAINLPSFMEGLSVEETVEKTSGATLLTTQVVSGRLYVSFDTTDNSANYLVVRLH